MVRKVGHLLHDILENIERVQQRTSGRNFEEFQHDWTFRFAIQRAIEIISEASRRLPDDLKASRPEIHWRSIAGIGNVLRHEYEGISDKVIWDIIQKNLPELKMAVEAIANAVDE
jgi:uncharacterized protein with HEPN domain